MKAILALEDGAVFEGQGFGAPATTEGEVCFNTSMSGYQEILTDPSYKGQIVAMTCPHVGNYGVNAADVESWMPHVSGFVVRELSPVASNWRSQEDLSHYLARHGIPGIQGLDTRALTKRLRVRGSLAGVLSTAGIGAAEAVARARAWGGMAGRDYVGEVTHREAFLWDPEDRQSGAYAAAGSKAAPLPPADIPLVAYDFGIKYNILRQLRQSGFRVWVAPAHTTAEEALALKPAGVFLSNGPGDPGALGGIVREVAALVHSGTPIFGICLGHQLLGQAFGGRTFKLKFGHRGANQPVLDHETGRVEITSQNHGFAVDSASLPADVAVNRTNLNDQTVEGLRHRTKPVFSVQYHPEASPGPHDSTRLFSEFRALLERRG